jgi:hypothetical protein
MKERTLDDQTAPDFGSAAQNQALRAFPRPILAYVKSLWSLIGHQSKLFRATGQVDPDSEGRGCHTLAFGKESRWKHVSNVRKLALLH